jgi:hypothetical protein
MFKAAKGAAKSALKSLGSGRMTWSASRGNSEMSIDPLADQPPSSSSTPTRKILLKESHLGLKDSRERKIFKELKNMAYTHTPVLNLALLHETGMDAKFDLIFPLVVGSHFGT